MKNKSHKIFNSTEHSIIIFLLDAIECAPEKALLLCNIASNKLRSDKFYSYIYRLKNASSVLNEANKIREELR